MSSTGPSASLPNDEEPSLVAKAMAAFLRLESAGGLLLVAMMVLALVVVNSPLESLYHHLLTTRGIVGIGPLVIDKPLEAWVNDGLMALFFLVVALEIKREAVDGELRQPAQILLPAVAAVGGMAVPALLYSAFAWGDGSAMRGWAIPSATDIAFSLGVLAVLGKRVPLSLRLFLTALAIIDDLGAIVIIALFYSHDLSVPALAVGAVALLGLIWLNRSGVTRLLPYLLLGLVLWVCMLKSGIHATIAGVLLGLCVPWGGKNGATPLSDLEHGLHPWVAYLILPVFAFVNSGLPLHGMGWATFTDPVFLGVTAGLFIGKQVGVFAAAGLVVRLGLAKLPAGAGWGQFYGVAVLTGIGFTMSLFIGALAFPDGEALAETRLGVLLGSLLSAVFGWVILASCRGQGKTA